MKKEVYGKVDQIVDYVLAEYISNDTEFNGCFLEFIPKELTDMEVLMAYDYLQQKINGDDILLVSNLETRTLFLLRNMLLMMCLMISLCIKDLLLKVLFGV